MSYDKQTAINEKLSSAASEIELVLNKLSEAASVAVLDKQFIYSETLISVAKSTGEVRSRILAAVIEAKPSNK